MVTPQFLNIGTTNGKVELQTISCRPGDSDLVTLSTLDPWGGKIKSYIWVNWGGDTGDELCWLDGETWAKPVEPVYFNPADALWVEGSSAENMLTSAGEVSTSDAEVQLCDGATMVGNASPVPVNLQDIFCRPGDSDLVTLSTLDPWGGKIKSYIWVNWGGDTGDELCWLDGETWAKPVEPVMIDPGQGLWVEGSSEENKITFPGVELD